MKFQDFTDFLADKHAENYMGNDDDMNDTFAEWLCNLDGEEYIFFADKYAKEHTKQKLEDMMTTLNTFK